MFELAEPKDKLQPCEECKALQDASKDAAKSLQQYSPQHTGHRPRSRWYKDDREVVYQLECQHNLTRAKYELHRSSVTHDDPTYANPASVYRNLAILIRKGRLRS
jgi:hypothetical protein